LTSLGTERLPGRATAAGTVGYAKRHPAAKGHFRPGPGLTLSSIGVGTYLGDADDAGDRGYEAAIARAFAAGLNVVDTAINYRNMRSERAVGRAVRTAIAAGTVSRAEVMVATKGGYLPFDAQAPVDPVSYVETTYLRPGIIRPEELVAGCHCLAPRYLDDQIERSRANLGLETIDIYYLHNPEQQLAAVTRDEFMRRIRAAFEFLEQACAAGRIGCYGVATWNGLRADPGKKDFLALTALAGMAEQVAGERHRFLALQLPYNLAMPEAFALSNQPVADGRVTTLEAAVGYGMTAFASASLLQGKLAHDLPGDVAAHFPGCTTDAQRALQYTRSTPGVVTALCGMSSVDHVLENSALVAIPPLPASSIRSLFRESPE
jgi:aryl-alcohol dehydrogenase-like predicted oxidoreductase